MISIDDLTIGYGPHPVQTAISAQIGEGEIFAVVGDSGSGKSTLLRTMIGLMAPQGQPRRVPRRVVLRGAVPERGAVDLHERARERDAADGPPGRPAASGATRARAVQARIGGARGRRRPLPGEPERHAQACRARAALALDPSVLFLDEPRPDSTRSRRAGSTSSSSACATGSASRWCSSRMSWKASTASPIACCSSTARPTGRWRSAPRPTRALGRKRQGAGLPFRRGTPWPAERDAHRRVRPWRHGARRRRSVVLRRRRVARRLAIVSFFDASVQGLRVGAPVDFRGVPVGEVKSMGVRVNPRTGVRSSR